MIWNSAIGLLGFNNQEVSGFNPSVNYYVGINSFTFEVSPVGICYIPWNLDFFFPSQPSVVLAINIPISESFLQIFPELVSQRPLVNG